MSQISASQSIGAQACGHRVDNSQGPQYYYTRGQLSRSLSAPGAARIISPAAINPADQSWKEASGQARFRILRQAYPEFIYRGFWLTCQSTRLQVIYDFSVPGLAEFRPELIFPLPACAAEEAVTCSRAMDELSLRSLFCAGLMESISYWKACCNPTLTIQAAGLEETEKRWWLRQFYHGLGEFIYRNGLDLQQQDLLTIKTCCPAVVVAGAAAAAIPDQGHSCLIPVGGGKDSVVSLMRTRTLNIRRYAFGVNSGPAALTCMELAGIPAENQLIVRRKLDQTLLKLNQLGFLNGHTPFSALLAFLSYYTAYVWQIPFVVLSNEASADEPSVAGTDVNHQYSKSYAFEADFRQYTGAYLGNQVYYFSLLRPFAEILIARDFARYPAFYRVFRSCNVGSKQNLWCGHCAKCLFVAIILAPFMSLSVLEDIWGKNMFADPDLLPTLDELCGLTTAKPFECVGTVAEVRLALSLAIRQALAGGLSEADLPLLWRHFLELAAADKLPGVKLEQPSLSDAPSLAGCRLPQADSSLQALLSDWQNGQAIPLQFRPCLEGMLAWPADSLRRSDNPQPPLARLLAYLSHKRILILGMGREGQASLRFLLRHYEALGQPELGVADARPVTLPALDRQVCLRLHTGADYLEAVPQYDLVLKSPGISFKAYTDTWLAPGILKVFPHTEISGQIDLFLRFPPTSRLVGVTGTKGKTTTSTIIADICRGSGWKTWLMGNIGVPVLDAYEQIAAGDIAVLELSCHQLQFVQASPPLALITNLYEEHLDHYRSYDEYCDSKLNIARWQQPEQCFILNDDDPDLKRRCEGLLRGRVKRISEADGEALRKLNPHLNGRHHAYDLAFAATVCQELGISADNIQAGVRSFPGIPHRCEYLGDFSGIHFYNDSIATIPRATEYAIETLGNVATLIVGGMDRGLDYKEFIQYLRQSQVSHFICLPDTGRQVLEAIGPRRAVAAQNMAEAVRLAYQLTPPGSSCLLSPAASSYNSYKNFEARGDDFRRQILAQADPHVAARG
ncbi:UDP-N-acetylmuramoyl-L-alanine--D-glutamate ligase [Oscillospiraceae bacterium HV4-5-C5C]|nr:UDP-N-acetylmuramoyl-L-alanine--D-glutamate ligase [Oscillospiraceae bacterium HV4-5-C5C]